MPRKVTVESLQTRLAHYNEQLEASEKRKADLEEKRQKVLQEIREKERAARTHTLCGLGGLVLKYFGDGISPEEFQTLLSRIFRIADVQEMVNAEKEKRVSADNVTDAAEIISEETHTIISDKNEDETMRTVPAVNCNTGTGNE